jgi:hypothetical protein
VAMQRGLHLFGLISDSHFQPTVLFFFRDASRSKLHHETQQHELHQNLQTLDKQVWFEEAAPNQLYIWLLGFTSSS